MIRRLAVLVLMPTLASAQVCPPPCTPPGNFIQVPIEGRRLVGPSRLEGDLFGQACSVGGVPSCVVEITIDGSLKPAVFLSVRNPGATEFIRWETAPLALSNGAHVAEIIVRDLANPSCPRVDVIHFSTIR
jgi:hypothetical protein